MGSAKLHEFHWKLYQAKFITTPFSVSMKMWRYPQYSIQDSYSSNLIVPTSFSYSKFADPFWAIINYILRIKTAYPFDYPWLPLTSGAWEEKPVLSLSLPSPKAPS
jgi:hypothetical protein